MTHDSPLPDWLRWAQQVQAIAQTGLTYSQNAFDVERYEALHRIAAQMMAAYSDAEPEFVEALFHTDFGHATPKIDVRAAVFQGDEILLVRERSTGAWTLPGGFADIGESPGEAIAREVREESGYTVRTSRLLALYDRARHDHSPVPFYCYKVFFECELLGGEAAGSLETTEVGFFPRDALPEIDRRRVTPAQLERLWEMHRHPDGIADFD